MVQKTKKAEEKILKLLSQEKFGMNIMDFCVRLNISRPVITKLLYRLERDGIIASRIVGTNKIFVIK